MGPTVTGDYWIVVVTQWLEFGDNTLRVTGSSPVNHAKHFWRNNWWFINCANKLLVEKCLLTVAQW